MRKGSHISEETRAKLRAASLGRKISMDTRAKIRTALIGRTFSTETLARMSAASTGRVVSAKTRAKISAALIGRGCTGRKASPETRARMSAAWIGHKVSPKTRAKLRAAHLGKTHTLETRGKMSASHRGKPLSAEHAARALANQWRYRPRPEYKGIRFRSSYEVRAAKAFDAHGINWEYEPTRFNLGTCSYLPDFYLPTLGVYWEVKGWLQPCNQQRIARFRELYPATPLVVATEPVLRMMEE